VTPGCTRYGDALADEVIARTEEDIEIDPYRCFHMDRCALAYFTVISSST
jgi:hypothetical protein